MTRLIVAEHSVWDEYPGVRVGRLYSGAGDLGRHPGGATHAVAAADAAVTVCGLPRAGFPYDFAVTVDLTRCEPCATCGLTITV